MTCPTTNFGIWILYGPKIDQARKRLHDLIFPTGSKATPNYGPNDRNWIGLRILEYSGFEGLDMDKMARRLIDTSDPEEIATVESVLEEFDKLSSHRTPNCA